MMAGLNDSALSLASQPSISGGLATAPHRGTKSARQQTKDEDKSAMPAAAMTALPATLVLPLTITSFSRESGRHDQRGRLQSTENDADQPQQAVSAKDLGFPTAAPAETSAVNPASAAGAESGQPAASQAVNTESARPASESQPPQNASTVSPGNLAFAARLQPATAASPAPGASQSSAQHEILGAGQSLPRKAAESDTTDTPGIQPVTAGAGSALNAYGHSSANAETFAQPPAAPAQSGAPSQAAEVKPAAAQAKPAAAPLKDISLQVAQPGSQKVEVRLVQQSGELRVAVRTGDSDLAHGLQQGLTDLVGRLQETGFRAEAWRPGGSVEHSGPVFEPRSSSSSSQKDDSQSYSGGSQQQHDQRRQDQSARPKWVEELENRIAGGKQYQGATYGISS